MPLRDASRGTEGDAGKIVHLVTGEDGDETVDAGSPSDPVDEPPRPPAGGGARPSLKRVK
jgi:stringent starvation protein B